jgi:hypothetical protein
MTYTFWNPKTLSYFTVSARRFKDAREAAIHKAGPNVTLERVSR